MSQIDPRDDKGLIGKHMDELKKFIPNYYSLIFLSDDTEGSSLYPRSGNILSVWLDKNNRVREIK